jgi:hypothetical protein
LARRDLGGVRRRTALAVAFRDIGREMAVEAGFDFAPRPLAQGAPRASVEEKNSCALVCRLPPFVASAVVSLSSRFA